MEALRPGALAAQLAALVLLPPLMPGLIARVKAWAAGRRGPPLLQPWRDIVKLARKGAVYSTTTTALFRLGPVLALAATLAAGLVVPLAGPAPAAFPGDALLFAGLLALARFATLAAALDAGSSFEGMGASREAAFASLAEPALFLALAALAQAGGGLSLTGMFQALAWRSFGAGAVLVTGALGLVLLAENSRVPVDDPATHLELTMLHEVMVLDHGGPDLAFISLAAALKLFLFSSLLARLLVPLAPGPAGWAAWAAGMAGVAAAVGVVESSMARLRLPRVPQLLVAASCAAAFALILALR